MAIASGIWYGLVSYLAFRAGANWDALTGRITYVGRWIAVGAAVVIAVGALVWWLRQRRSVQP
jgi:membrane protein DedA with SNARE-associated domain